MKKLFIYITIITSLFVFATFTCAKDPGPYIGVGGSFVYEDFNTGISVNVEDTHGINLKVGYRISDVSSWELNFDFLPGFKGNYSTTYYGYPADVIAEGDVRTYMLISKLSPDFHSKTIRPFIVAGLGVMQGKMIEELSIFGYPIYSVSTSKADVCAKFGLGTEMFVEKNVSVSFEGAYIWGFGEMDMVRYIDYTLGIIYHF